MTEIRVSPASPLLRVRGAMSPGELFEVIHRRTPILRSELGELTKLARTGLKTLVEPLLDLGLVAEQEGPSTGGRPPVQFAFDPAGGVVLAASLGRSHSLVAITDLSARIIAELRSERHLDEGPEAILGWVADGFDRLLLESGRTPADVCAVGVCAPGPVEFATGRPIDPPLMPGWHAVPISDWFRERYSVPVVTDNDANGEALGEYWTHWRQQTNDMIYVKAGTGIGSGIIAGGVLQRGAQGGAGEIGHLIVDASSTARCRCGSRGCLEAVAGGAAVAEHLRRLGHDVADARDVAAAALAGNPDAARAIRDVGRALGTALASAVALLNPNMVVVGGAFGRCEEHLLVGVREVIYQGSMVLHLSSLEVVSGRLGDRAGVIGAAVNALDLALCAAEVDRRCQQRSSRPRTVMG